jgi:hypothetical protein
MNYYLLCFIARNPGSIAAADFAAHSEHVLMEDAPASAPSPYSLEHAMQQWPNNFQVQE